MIKNKKLLLWAMVPIVFILHSCSPKANLSFYSPNSYYQTQYNDSTFFFKFTEITSKKAEGVYYSTGVNPIAEPIPFKYTLRKVSKKIPFVIDTAQRYTFPSKPAVYPERYKKELYKVDVIKNVPFARVEGYWDSYITENESFFNIFTNGITNTLRTKKLELKMDIYMPVNAGPTPRPFLMIIHGGAFYIGDKESTAIVAFCKYYASLGYTTASINYRLGFTPSKTSVERAGYQALQDAHAAMRFMVANWKTYQIDTSLIFVCGSSAGAITAINLAFMRNEGRPESSRKSFFNDDLGNIETSGNLIRNTFTIKAIGNMWGAVNDLNHLKNADAAVVSFHGDKDRIVPYWHDYPFEIISKDVGKAVFGKMYGSYEIHKTLKRLNRREKLYTFENSDHEPHVDAKGNPNSKHHFIRTNMADFFYEEIVPTPVDIFRNYNNLQIFNINTTDFSDIIWGIDGGFIIEATNNSVKVVWKGDAKNRTLSVSGRYKNGAPFYRTIIIND